MFGGGLRYFINRTDGINLIDYAKQKGYNVVTTLGGWSFVLRVFDLQEFRGDIQIPVIAVLAWDRLSFEIDRDPAVQPSLAEMTSKALDLLARQNKGFFVMVEGE